MLVETSGIKLKLVLENVYDKLKLQTTKTTVNYGGDARGEFVSGADHMGSRLYGIERWTTDHGVPGSNPFHGELSPNIDFEYVFLDLTKNSKSGSHMVGIASLALMWSAPLTNSPRAAATWQPADR